MRGFYTINGETYENLITARGKGLILDYLAGDLVFWGDQIAVGISNVAPADADTRLGFELGRARVNVTESNITTNSVMLKATLPNEVIGNIYEIGLFSTAEKREGAIGPATLSDFTVQYLEVTNLTDSATESRIGESGALLSGGTGSIDNIWLPLEGRAPTDEITLAYYTLDVLDSIEVRFYTSATAYYTYTFVPSTGYNLAVWSKMDMTTPNGANWVDAVERIEFVQTGVGSVMFDGMKIDSLENTPGSGLVSRSTLVTPIDKTFEDELEIEYTIEFGW